MRKHAVFLREVGAPSKEFAADGNGPLRLVSERSEYMRTER